MIYREIVIENKNNKNLIPKEESKNTYYSSADRRRSITEYNEDFATLSKENNNNFFAFIYDVGLKNICVGYAYKQTIISKEKVEEVILNLIKEKDIKKNKEISFTDFQNRLDSATRNYTNYSFGRILDKLEINIEPKVNWYDPPLFKHEDEMYINKNISKKELLSKAKKMLASDSLLEEIDRIYSNKNEKVFYGHPVHYYITAGNWNAAKDIIDILIPALLKNKRLTSERVSFIHNISYNAYNEPHFENIFNNVSGACLVVDLSGEQPIGNYARDYHRNAEVLGKKLASFGSDTLFIFVEIVDEILYRDENLATILGNGDIIKIDEGFGNYDEALTYLNELVDKSEFRKYKEKRMEKYLPDNINFTVSDIYEAFNRWYGKGLKSHIYKAYKLVDTVKIKVKKVESDPHKVLNEMVGLTNIKEVINEIIDYNKIQIHRKEMGLRTPTGSRHMLFYGNPGSAKSTVARLMGQILKAEGVLENGQFVEVGRQDLVAKYVGWTAKAVEQKFKEARGGILFIDEAYALTEDYNSFGTEAINTIVQLMENYRDEVIVIFAGYPEKMKEFIKLNEGLASRIAFQLDFPDYNETELLGILDIMLKNHGYTMDSKAKDKCLELFKKAIKIENYGNGRFVRNILEQIELRQAKRLSLETNKEIDKEEISLLKEEDIIDDYNFLTEKETNRIGFNA